MLILTVMVLAGILYFTVLRKPAFQARLRWGARHLLSLLLSAMLIFVMALIAWSTWRLVEHARDFTTVHLVSAGVGTLVLIYVALVILNTIFVTRGTRVAWLARIDLTKRRHAG